MISESGILLPKNIYKFESYEIIICELIFGNECLKVIFFHSLEATLIDTLMQQRILLALIYP